VGAGFLERCLEDFKTFENFAFAFHGHKRDSLRAIVDKGNKVFIAFTGGNLEGANIRVD
jgi:hypothetical protein